MRKEAMLARSSLGLVDFLLLKKLVCLGATRQASLESSVYYGDLTRTLQRTLYRTLHETINMLRSLCMLAIG